MASPTLHLPGGDAEQKHVRHAGFPAAAARSDRDCRPRYPDDDPASEWPSYLHVVSWPDGMDLPNSAELTAAFDEVCAHQLGS